MTEFQYDRVIERILTRNRWGSEKELAKALGISANTWTAWKQGKSSFGVHEVTKICDVLEVTPRWLLFGDQSLQKLSLLDRVHALVDEVYALNKMHLSKTSLGKAANDYFVALSADIVSEDDTEEVGMRLHLLRKRIEKDIVSAAAAPGSGKRSAS